MILGILACAGLYLIGNGRVPLWDRDEGWYAQCSKQMWETGNWVVPMFLDNLRTEKPIFVYWLQLGGYALFGGPGDFAVRFYAGIMQTLVLIIVGFSLFKLVGPLRGAWTAFIYGTCAMAIISAKMCLTDATLMVFVMTAQLCLMAFYLGKFNWWAVLLMFVALGFGALTKGPVAFVPTLLTIVVLAIFDYKRWFPLVKPRSAEFWNRLSLILLVVLGGLAIAVAICAPWLIELHQREPRWIPGVLNTANQHFTQSMDGHRGPFGYYMLLVWATFFPWSLLIPTAAYVAWKQRHNPQTRFAIAAFIGPWLFFEIMKTKLPHYPLPTYPFLALMVADALVRCARGEYQEFYKPRFVVAVGIWAVLIGALASAPWIAAAPWFHWDDPLPYGAMVVVSLMGYVFTLGTFWFFRQGKPLVAAGWMGGTFILLIALLYGWLLPQATYLHTSSRVAEILREFDGLGDKAPIGDVVTLIYPEEDDSYGYREPTLPYYQGGTLRELKTPRYLDTVPRNQWPRLMIITDEIYDRFVSDKAKQQIEILGTVRGYLYSDERRITDVMVIRAKK